VRIQRGDDPRVAAEAEAANAAAAAAAAALKKAVSRAEDSALEQMARLRRQSDVKEAEWKAQLARAQLEGDEARHALKKSEAEVAKLRAEKAGKDDALLGDNSSDELRQFKTVVKLAVKGLMLTAKQHLAEEASRAELRGALKKAEAATASWQ
jgi:hypothetical protein